MSPIYKYFSQQSHLQSFLENGDVFFNSLSYFLACEDDSRRDDSENMNIYGPRAGLVVNNLTTGKTFTIPAQLVSRVNASDRIFVFCTSTELSARLYGKFSAAGCVEISNLEAFKNRLQAKINELFESGDCGNKTLLVGRIEYYERSDTPGSRYACPDQIVMAKPDRFSDENEFRFAFAKDQNAFDVNNVQYSIEQKSKPSAVPHSHMPLRIGPLVDICRIVSP